MLVVGDPATVIAQLISFAKENLRVRITTAMVQGYLTSHGLPLRRLSRDSRILPAIEELRQQFEDSIKNDLIAGQIIPRKETEAVLTALGESLDSAR